MHSTFSDGKLTIPELVDTYGQQGFGAIAITDHLCETSTLIGKAARALDRTLTPALFPIYLKILASEADRAWRRYRMRVIPGFELTKNRVLNRRSAHILALGVTQWINADLPVETLIAQIHAQGGLAIAAHPVPTRKIEKQTYYLWDNREALSSHFDAWEVASGPYLFEEVFHSELPKIANSDLHRKEQMTSWKTEFSGNRTQEQIFNDIRHQNVAFRFYQAQENENSLWLPSPSSSSYGQLQSV